MDMRQKTKPVQSRAASGDRILAEGDAAAFLTNSTPSEGGGLHRLLVESVRDYAIFALDVNGNILSWNAGAERLKGYTSEEIIGKHFSIFYTPEDLAIEKPVWELEIAEGVGKYEEEGWRVKKDGSLFWANVVITAIKDRNGQLLGFAKITRDLTERIAAQERAIADAHRIATAEASNRAKSEFLRAMSHELRTPINATLGYTELLEMGIGGEVAEPHQTYLKRIRATQEHLLHIINDLLNYSKVEAGHVEYDLEPVLLTDLIDSMIPMLHPQATAKGIDLSHAECSKKLSAMTDRIRAEQIVLNLLSNAVKFTPEGGAVVVECGKSAKSVTISVTDTGPGIDPDQQQKIFEPFVQLGRTLSSGHEGTGLGLAISRDLARSMSGDLTVTSATGEGATFTLSLPAA